MKYQNFKEFKAQVHAPKLNKMSGDRLYWLERNVSVRISWVLLKIFPKVKPNHITLISFLILGVVLAANFFKSSDNINMFYIITIVQLVVFYFIAITDRIDGEIARAIGYFSQKGIYYDYTVHFFHPIVFYFTVAYFFYLLNGQALILYAAILLSVITMYWVMFRQTAMFVGGEIKKIKERGFDINDYVPQSDKPKKRAWLPFRMLDYLTFMLYAWTLFFYIALVIVSFYNFQLAYNLYVIHIIYSLVVISYRMFWSYPRKKLYQKV